MAGAGKHYCNIPFKEYLKRLQVTSDGQVDPDALRLAAAQEFENYKTIERCINDAQVNPIAGTYSGKASYSSSTNVAHATYVLVPLDTLVHDNANMVDLANDRINITVSGYYLLSAEISFAFNATASRQVLISKNGGPYPAGTLLTSPAVNALTDTQTHVLTTTQAELVAGDYLTLGAYQSSGVTLGVGGTHGTTQLTVTLIGQFISS